MKLRQGRRVPQHIYLQVGDLSSDNDPPLFTVPSPALAEIIVAATNQAVRALPEVREEFEKAAEDLVVLG